MRVSMVVWNEFLHDARVRKQAESLAQVGYKVTVFALHKPGVTLQRERMTSGIDVVRVARSPFARSDISDITALATTSVGRKFSSNSIGRLSFPSRVFKVSARLWAHGLLVKHMVSSKPDVVHAHDVNTLPTAWLVSLLSKAPLIYDAHEISTSREGYASFRKLVGGVEKRLAPRAAGMITTTEARAKFFARAYGVPRPLVLQNRPRLASLPSSDRIRRELNLNNSWPIVLYQGGLQQGRGLELLIRAAAMVPRAWFVFIGGGRLEAELKALTRDLGVEDRVRFIPTVSLDELPLYTASADLGVQPIENTCLNHFTTDSNKLFEYVIAGLPVVSSDLPEIRRVVRSYELGRLVRPGDMHALAAAIRELVENSDLRGRFSRNACLAAQTLNWEAQESALLELYERVLGSRRNLEVVSERSRR